jgi:N-acetylglutamate synthase-like GNAT family acetyltransferase
VGIFVVQQPLDIDFVAALDGERRLGGEQSKRGGIVREYSPDRSRCQIVYSRCSDREIGEIVRLEVIRAQLRGYVLEWKAYGHDLPASLTKWLVDAGFVAGDVENVLVASTEDRGHDVGEYEIQRILDDPGLDDYVDVSRQLGRVDADQEADQLAMILEDAPEELSVYIAYVDDLPVACGRTHFKAGSVFVELAGGRTKTTHRRRGLFSALVATRLAQARDVGRTHAFVDALPTSEPILRKLGFEYVTTTQPFVYDPMTN